MNNNFFFSIGGIIMIVVFLGGGLWVILGTIRNRKKGEASLNWPSTSGTIIRTWVEESYTEDDDGWKTYTYSPRWEYQFIFMGRTYTCNRLSYGATKGYGSESEATQALSRYPVNTKVQVYYDPNNAEDAVLIPGAKGTMIGFFLGGIFVTAAVIMLVVGLIITLK
jgi:hypothetical protein